MAIISNIQYLGQGQHYYCFLCSTLIQDSPPPPTPLAAEQIALCKDFLNEIDPTNYVENNNSQSKCCHNCVPGIQQVWDLNQDILIIRRRIVNILSELGRRRHEGNLQTFKVHNLQCGYSFTIVFVSLVSSIVK